MIVLVVVVAIISLSLSLSLSLYIYIYIRVRRLLLRLHLTGWPVLQKKEENLDFPFFFASSTEQSLAQVLSHTLSIHFSPVILLLLLLLLLCIFALIICFFSSDSADNIVSFVSVFVNFNFNLFFSFLFHSAGSRRKWWGRPVGEVQRCVGPCCTARFKHRYREKEDHWRHIPYKVWHDWRQGTLYVKNPTNDQIMCTPTITFSPRLPNCSSIFS